MEILTVQNSIFFVIFLIEFSYEDDDISFDTDSIDLSHFGTRIYGYPNDNLGNVIKSWEKSEHHDDINPEELGSYAEGDILFPGPKGRNGILSETYRWSNGIVPFEIRGNFKPNEMALIEDAMNSYHKNTCIKFVPRKENDQDYIIIQNSASGCWSSVGKVGGSQTVNLQSPGCVFKIGTVIHELMHAIGFVHEQNREERDDHVMIQFQNVQKGTETNFEKAPKGTTTNFGVEYDYGSVMHYSAKAFSTNGQPTIIAKRKTNAVMGQREGFSAFDIQKIWKMYTCKATTSSTGYKPSVSTSSTSSSSSSFETLPNLVGEFFNSIFPSGDEEEIQKFDK